MDRDGDGNVQDGMRGAIRSMGTEDGIPPDVAMVAARSPSP